MARAQNIALADDSLSVDLMSSPEAPVQDTAACVRSLTGQELEKLKNDRNLVSEFKQAKLEKEAQKNWDLFYKRNTVNFFKDRHWTTREFEELRACKESQGQKLVLLEAGCGVGNCIFPLLEEDLDVFVYACDFSHRAVEFVKQNPLYCAERCKVFQCDLTKDELQESISAESVDVAMLIFVLSAIHPDKMPLALKNIFKNCWLTCLLAQDSSLWQMNMCSVRQLIRRRASVCPGCLSRASFASQTDDWPPCEQLPHNLAHMVTPSLRVSVRITSHSFSCRLHLSHPLKDSVSRLHMTTPPRVPSL
ncbi:tRNA N(3)-cytidine methyltransferase METTL6 isoform X1 [Scleropages formosus]|uniref:Methyltransferase 6, methylcytidine n=1 Tax=Scleropages formosus TaxID=113540 RepID=A0A8C9T1P3_SCLFO|nr:methyltransferase-like protein 6 isoform X1 [Scleropages formosus]